MNVSTKQQRIAELAKQQPEMSFTSLNHYLDVDWLREAYRRLRQASAPGYDGQTVADYGQDLESNLQSLLDRAKSGSYFAPPVRRVHIPKGTGNETRPIGIPMVYAYCISLPRRLGIAIVVPTSTNSRYQLKQYNGLVLTDQIDSDITSS
jgi:retron-type reverse transcriptase